ncbi:hypothetical protein DICVIV_13832 [Dictyocaulus viviparus]|uniref:Uncharacterized protein n=1 Tax=Dictyocaulus viviparus TaxID=29172 RepID=A0A0D8X6V1_DICVI|nr:hypothetical protein DICVIV_13832 [Dictyocaulus viviparus]
MRLRNSSKRSLPKRVRFKLPLWLVTNQILMIYEIKQKTPLINTKDYPTMLKRIYRINFQS